MAVWLQEGMAVMLQPARGLAIAIELPARVTLEIIETEPAMKGQTASSSYKPAMLTNGARALVPAAYRRRHARRHLTDDGSYVERAKDWLSDVSLSP